MPQNAGKHVSESFKFPIFPGKHCPGHPPRGACCSATRRGCHASTIHFSRLLGSDQTPITFSNDNHDAVKNVWRILNTIVSIWHENVHKYLSLDTNCFSKHNIFLKLCSWKTVYSSEQIMSVDKYASIFLCQMEAIVYLSSTMNWLSCVLIFLFFSSRVFFMTVWVTCLHLYLFIRYLSFFGERKFHNMYI